MEVTGEVQVHVFHGHNLCVAAARSPALHAEAGAQRGFTDTDHSVLADGVQAVTQTDGGGGLAFARRGRVDRRDEDQFAVLLALL
ncbi:MAG: Uncharacterised protein [Rhodospirillaceae bacterium]|nr:MAG: Uncharacterised protein [Rhodospirillaceae bacterium]